MTTIHFPTAANDFYRLRDDRTNRLVAARSYSEKMCRVTVDPEQLWTLSGQVMLLASCNLLSRWCRKIHLDFSDIAPHPSLGIAGNSLRSALLAQMSDSDPFGVLVSEPANWDRADLGLHIGSHCPTSSIPTTLISSCGWHAGVFRSGGAGLNALEGPNCVGALTAAALGGAQIFRDAVGKSGFSAPGFIFDGFDVALVRDIRSLPFHEYSDDLEIGGLLLVGAGSVGSAVMYCLKLLRVNCAITVVDRDAVGIENLNRSPVFGKSNYNMNKAEAMKVFCEGSTIGVKSVPLWWDQFVADPLAAKENFDIWLPLANERDIRWALQNQIPPLMVHASTMQSWGVNFGRHIPGRDDCLIDRFPSDASASVLTCSSGPAIKVAGKQVDAALPFLSFLAGVLVASDLVKLKLAGYPYGSNFSLLDVGGNEFGMQSYDRKPRSGCVCLSQASPFWKIRGSGRYARLSPRHW